MASGDFDRLDLTLISRRFPPQIGGAERVMSNFADAFGASGHRVTVLSSEDPSDGIPRSKRTETAGNSDRPVIVRLPYNGIRFVGTALYMRSLRRWLTRNRPDVIYVSMLKHDAFVATQWGRTAGVPVILRPEGAGETGDMAWQRRDRFGARIREVTITADAFVALSERIRDEMIDAGYDASRIVVIPNGVPVPETPWSLTGPIENPRAVFVGRLAHEKGVDRLLKAWPFVLREMPQARLTIVGDGLLMDSLRALAADLKISRSVDFSGAQPDVHQDLMRSDVFVLPSREEGLSIALLEAMAVGMPVVVADIPGNRPLVKPDMTGQIVDAESAQELATAILAAFRKPSEILWMANAARELVESQYSVRNAAIQHERLFRETLARKAKARQMS